MERRYFNHLNILCIREFGFGVEQTQLNDGRNSRRGGGGRFLAITGRPFQVTIAIHLSGKGMRRHVLKEPRICGVDCLLLIIMIVEVLLSCVGLSCVCPVVCGG